MTREEIYDEISRTLTDYESDDPEIDRPGEKDLYELLVKVQRHWEDVITAEPDANTAHNALVKAAKELLTEEGYSPKKSGFNMLADAVALTIEANGNPKFRGKIYKEISENYGKEIKTVQGNISNILKTVNPDATNIDEIIRLADKIRYKNSNR